MNNTNLKMFDNGLHLITAIILHFLKEIRSNSKDVGLIIPLRGFPQEFDIHRAICYLESTGPLRHNTDGTHYRPPTDPINSHLIISIPIARATKLRLSNNTSVNRLTVSLAADGQ